MRRGGDAVTLTKTLLGQCPLELCRLDHARIDEEQSQARIGCGLIENEPQHANKIEWTERLHDVRARPDRSREGAALGIVPRGQHHHAYVPRSCRASKLATHGESVARGPFEGHVEEDDLRLVAAGD